MGRGPRRQVRVDHARGDGTEQERVLLIRYIIAVPERTIVCVRWRVDGRLAGARGAGGGEAGRLRPRRRRSSMAGGNRGEGGVAELLILHAAHRPDPRDAADGVEEALEGASGEALVAGAKAAVDVLQLEAVGRRVGIKPSAAGEEAGAGHSVQTRCLDPLYSQGSSRTPGIDCFRKTYFRNAFLRVLATVNSQAACSVLLNTEQENSSSPQI